MYDRATLLCQVFGDEGFIADSGDQGKAEDRLDEYTNDLCLTFVELRLLWKQYPKRAQWKNGKLRRMYDDMVQAATDNQTSRLRRNEATATTGGVGRPQSEGQTGPPQVAICGEPSELDRLRGLVKTLQRENRDLRKRLTKLKDMLEPAFM